MRKNIWGHLRLEMAPLFTQRNFYFLIIFFALIFFQLILRFSQLDFHGLWRDEVATLYFSGHLSEVISGDSHSFFYYLLMAPVGFLSDYSLYESRLFQGGLSFFLYVVILIRSRSFLKENEWFIFNSLYGLHPLVFGFARLARPYSLMIDLATLFILESRLNKSKLRMGVYACLMMCMHPFGVVPVLIEGVIQRFDRNYLKMAFLASLPMGIYYLAKIIIDPNPTGYIGWIDSSFQAFFFDLNGILLGSFFPDYQLGSPETVSILVVFFVLSLGTISLVRKDSEGKKEFLRFVSIYIGLFLGMSLLALVVDLRVQRYYVFLVPYFIFMLSKCMGAKRKLTLVTMWTLGTLLILQVAYLNPYFSPRPSFGRFVSHLKHLSKVNRAPVYACGYSFMNWYFKRQGFMVCSNKDDENLARVTSPLVYGFMDKQLSILPQLMNNNHIELVGGSFDNKIFLVTPKAENESRTQK